jgi:ATP-dependent DNA ligase
MLLRSATLPLTGDYAYEVKWDGFRALVSQDSSLSVRSRNGWDMTSLLPELAEFPGDLVLDGELVVLGDDQRPNVPRLCERMLQGTVVARGRSARHGGHRRQETLGPLPPRPLRLAQNQEPRLLALPIAPRI